MVFGLVSKWKIPQFMAIKRCFCSETPGVGTLPVQESSDQPCAGNALKFSWILHHFCGLWVACCANSPKSTMPFPSVSLAPMPWHWLFFTIGFPEMTTNHLDDLGDGGCPHLSSVFWGANVPTSHRKAYICRMKPTFQPAQPLRSHPKKTLPSGYVKIAIENDH